MLSQRPTKQEHVAGKVLFIYQEAFVSSGVTVVTNPRVSRHRAVHDLQ